MFFKNLYEIIDKIKLNNIYFEFYKCRNDIFHYTSMNTHKLIIYPVSGQRLTYFLHELDSKHLLSLLDKNETLDAVNFIKHTKLINGTDDDTLKIAALISENQLPKNVVKISKL